MEPREEEAWAATLQWRTHDQDLRQVVRAIIARLDSMFREEYGVRLDQIATPSELWTSALESAEWYKHADACYRGVSIYSHVRSGLDGLLRKRARRLVDERRDGRVGP